MHTTAPATGWPAATPGGAPVHLDDDTVAGLLDLESVIRTQEAAFADLAVDGAATTLRTRAVAGGVMASAMAAVVPRLGVAGAKVYATHAGRFSFHVVLWDLAGRLLCTLDGGALTAVRTPAASAIAIRRLATPGATVAGLVGTGRQALGHAEMLAHTLPLAELRISGRRPAQVEELVRHLRDREVPARAAPDPAVAADGAEVVVTATTAARPLFPSTAVARRALVCAVGATKADRCEIGADVVARCAAVVADSVEGSRTECGDLIQAAAAGAFTWDRAVALADVVAGTGAVPRAGEAGPVLFETQGTALQDIAAAGLAWARHAGGGHLPAPDHREDP
ncbi:MAG TPA: hypothetical protein VFZ79_11315 [Acidimicrobiales bacterium]